MKNLILAMLCFGLCPTLQAQNTTSNKVVFTQEHVFNIATNGKFTAIEYDSVHLSDGDILISSVFSPNTPQIAIINQQKEWDFSISNRWGKEKNTSYKIHKTTNNQFFLLIRNPALKHSEILRVNRDLSIDHSFARNSFKGIAYDLLDIGEGRLLVVGDFVSYNNQPISNVVCLNTQGKIDHSFSLPSQVNGVIHNIEKNQYEPNHKIMLSGNFTNYAGTDCYGRIRILKDGKVDETYKPREIISYRR